MLTNRDKKIRIFLEDFSVAETKHLTQLFFKDVSERRARQRLTALTNQGHISRQRSNINADYLYYIDKPQQIQHSLIRTDMYCHLNRLYRILRFDVEYSIGDMRSDAYIELQKGNVRYNFFLEVQLSNKFNQSKYEQLYASGIWKKELPAFPRILIVSDKHILIKPTELQFMQIISDLSELPQICSLLAQ